MKRFMTSMVALDARPLPPVMDSNPLDLAAFKGHRRLSNPALSIWILRIDISDIVEGVSSLSLIDSGVLCISALSTIEDIKTLERSKSKSLNYKSHCCGAWCTVVAG